MIWLCSSVSRGFCASRMASSSFLFRISSFFLWTSSSVRMTVEKLKAGLTVIHYGTACGSSVTSASCSAPDLAQAGLCYLNCISQELFKLVNFTQSWLTTRNKGFSLKYSIRVSSVRRQKEKIHPDYARHLINPSHINTLLCESAMDYSFRWSLQLVQLKLHSA